MTQSTIDRVLAAEQLDRRQQLLQGVLVFRGSPSDYWALLVQSLCQCLGGELAILYMQGEQTWLPVTHAPAIPADKLPALLNTVASELLAQAQLSGLACGDAKSGGWRVGLLSFGVHEEQALMAVVHLGQNALSEVQVSQWLAAFSLAPRLYEAMRGQRKGERDAQRLAHALALLGRVLEVDDFERAALLVVNDLATCFSCETVTLSWMAHEGLRLRAISHAEKLERRSAWSSLLEEAGQEALAQACEVTWPHSGKQLARAHQQYAELQRPGHLISLPLIQASTETRLGVLILERKGADFTAAERWALRLLGDLLMTPMQQLQQRARVLPQRLWSELLRSMPQRSMPITQQGRRMVYGLLLLIGLVLLAPLPYSVSAGALVKTDAMAYIGAPFDGYLESSAVTLGVAVKAGQTVFELSNRDLLLERASILADLAQSSREAEKRRSANQLPEMQIAEAQSEQAQAKLMQVEHRLANAQARSPIAGVVVEGEPGKNLGGAVRRGDVVLKVARLSGLYIEAAVPERHLSRVELGQSVRLTLLADPSKTYDLKLTRIVPAASVKDGDNTFPARVELNTVAPAWWRPGMSGSVKIFVGYRPLIWIATHRLVDYLRLLLWI